MVGNIFNKLRPLILQTTLFFEPTNPEEIVYCYIISNGNKPKMSG